ncbi:2Fe-2S iron-sulfur cluster binding domain-containing protein [Pedobacter petrophilus]|uniref:2Fe-2S iron-sulfur cluster binding domain-containing protein n=2 Tax=Pedobacter TaxID=84567 RepID=A0A7K0FS80_9SPHI|nr:2Fe-2S iron-sulfur cluster binding domain-containing protein [Pedobacter petrophilus]
MLLLASLNSKLSVPFSCGMSNCGKCRVKVVAGQINMSEPNALLIATVIWATFLPVMPGLLRLSKLNSRNN